MVAIVNNAFGGERPILQPRLLGDTEAQLAQNVRLVSGRIEPLKAPTELKVISATTTTIFRYGDDASEQNYWLTWQDQVHAVRSPVAGDAYDRLYWTGEQFNNVDPNQSYPRYAHRNFLTVNGSPSSYKLGIPAPTQTPSASGSAVVNATTVQREYVITYTNAASSPTLESLPSTVRAVSAVDGGDVKFTNLPDSNEGDTRVTHKRLYRKLSGVYRLVTTLDLATRIYTDNTTDATLASAAQLNSTLANALARPTGSPQGTVTGTAPTTTNNTAYVRSYVITFVDAEYTDGEGSVVRISESYPSAEFTPAQAIYNGQAVTITGFTVPAGVTINGGWKIYRKIAGAGQVTHRLIHTAPPGTTSFIDAVPVGSETIGTWSVASYPDSTKKPGAFTTSFGAYTPTSTEGRVYVVTFANNSGNESPPSLLSNLITVTDGQAVSVSLSVGNVPTGVTLKRLYRKLQSGAANTWKRVAELPSGTLTYSDVLTNSAISGNAGLPASFTDLLPAPTGVPVIEATIPEKKVPESRTYVYTYVSDFGEEGPPSEPSAVIDIDPTKTVTVNGLGVLSGAYALTAAKKRIYRSSSTGTGGAYQFVTEVAMGESSFLDNVTQSDLGEVLLTEDWEPPPAKLFGLRMMANGVAVGFVKDTASKTVRMSEPGLPHAWNPEYSYTTDDTIVGLGVFRQSVAVLTKSYPWVLSGVDPAAMTATRLEVPQGCVSSKSIVETGEGVVYASPDGLISISNNGVQNLTNNLFTREQWQAFGPSTMMCFFHDGRVHVLYDGGSGRGMLILDITGQGALLSQSDIQTTPNTVINGGYHDPKTDTLYFIQSARIKRFNASTTNLTYLWRSKVYKAPSPLNFVCGQVLVESYPINLKVYADGALKMTKNVWNANVFTLPSGFRASDWYFEVSNSIPSNSSGTAFPTTGLFYGYVFRRTSDSTSHWWNGTVWTAFDPVTPGKVYGVSIAQSVQEIKAT